MRTSFASILALVAFTVSGASAAAVNTTTSALEPTATVPTSALEPPATVPTCAPVPSKPAEGPRVCDPAARGSNLEQKQRIAIRDFTRLLWREGKVQEAFDTYIPGEFIQHNPGALSGRELAIPFLQSLWEIPGLAALNITSWAGEGIGSIHYRLKADAAGIDSAVFDKFRFQGDCIVEHWDVMQAIVGNETLTNPIAFF